MTDTGVGSTEPARSAAAGSAGGGADIWNERAQAYRESTTHASGDDLDLTVAWCEPGPGVTVLDVADEAFLVRDTDLEDWLARTETREEDAARVRELLGDRAREGRLELPTLVLKGVKTA